ncbi:N-acyl homoserine lactonase family protein [Thalassococcus sp. BH17M4-6]|uniref:N-acyl homoserine lactonase family protein n=1 Tax=Thalassococcus sp. BH17M4-6 TaxID=3413148 RepID=UPI003BED41BB
MTYFPKLATATAFAALTASAAAADVSLWRLDCGDVQVNYLNLFSDTNAYSGEKKSLVGSCYLIQHDDQYFLWDAGLPAGLLGAEQDPKAPIAPTLKTDIPSQLEQLDLSPADIDMIGISHYHFDHTGQAPDFPDAKLLIGAQDFETLEMQPLPAYAQGFADPKPLEHWLSGAGETQQITSDTDIFGDGSVMMLAMPGHTPGETALMVQLADTGPVLLSGDVVHFAEQLDIDGVPTFNYDRSETLASIDRLKKLVENTGATLIIQHDPRDVGKLPTFPEAAK